MRKAPYIAIFAAMDRSPAADDGHFIVALHR